MPSLFTPFEPVYNGKPVDAGGCSIPRARKRGS